MTSDLGCRCDMARAFSVASARAHAIAVCPASRAAVFIRASSIAAGSIMNAIPAASSIRARAVLAEASISGSGFAAMTPHIELVDCRGGLLDRTPRHVDNRPVMLGEDAARLAHLAADGLDVGVVGGFVMVEHAEPVAA